MYIKLPGCTAVGEGGGAPHWSILKMTGAQFNCLIQNIRASFKQNWSVHTNEVFTDGFVLELEKPLLNFRAFQRRSGGEARSQVAIIPL